MDHKTINRNDLEVSPICPGTNQFGTGVEPSQPDLEQLRSLGTVAV